MMFMVLKLFNNVHIVLEQWEISSDHAFIILKSLPGYFAYVYLNVILISFSLDLTKVWNLAGLIADVFYSTKFRRACL